MFALKLGFAAQLPNFALMFRTELTINPAVQQLSRAARVLTIGSCFAQSMGERLAGNQVAALVNPFGTVFQPLGVGKLLRAAAGEDVDWQQHLVEARGRWQSYDLHGSIGSESPVELLQRIGEMVYNVGTFLRNADVVVLTLGTGWAYRLRETGELVNNCHKMAAELFERELLTPDDIINGLAETHAYLRRINPKLKFVLTVSPVRHLRDTLPLNAVSKSVLRVACHYLSELLPDVAYFPAFELLTDDLRDYRFYADDMLHPSAVAEDYIWDKFARTYFDADFGRFRKEWAAVRQGLGHRPLYAGAAEHRLFLAGLVERLERLAGQGVDVAAELADVRERAAALPVLARAAEVVAEEMEDDEERIDVGATGAAETTGTAAPAALPVAARASEDDFPAIESSATGRLGRLSPEEFRAQRANKQRERNERRNGRGGRAVPVAAPDEAGAVLEAATETVVPETVATLAETTKAADLLPMQTVAVAADEAAAEVEGDGKKKKRRSRGGAKRTARKQAARLAEEMGGVGADEAEIAEAATAPAVTTGVTDGLPEPAVIPNPEPMKRGGRNQRGRGRGATVEMPDYDDSRCWKNPKQQGRCAKPWRRCR